MLPEQVGEHRERRAAHTGLSVGAGQRGVGSGAVHGWMGACGAGEIRGFFRAERTGFRAHGADRGRFQ
ncbi:hypothetical protein T484DRAFT_1929373 [Baffinella frigidus]|nr:hypothetical protein T484DRAFT_1929373 [Cryptophyta sp. CCMP2293]